MRALFTIAVVAIVAMPAAAQAQQVRAPVPHQQALSVNPLGFAFNWYNFEYERKITEGSTVGLSASHFGIEEVNLNRATLFARYYPQHAALGGAYLGGRLGILRAGHEVHESAVAVGMEIGYTWIYGEDRNVTIGIGGGTDRYFGPNGFTFGAPQIRLVQVGIAF